ncbi:glutamyl-tRNA reductase [bacterium]|nr:glutamyl-tRNA reductase [bacterium]
MSVFCFGMSHRTASMAQLGAFALAVEEKETLLRLLRTHELLHEAVVLSTCNRTEFYFVAEELAPAHDALLELVREAGGRTDDELLAQTYLHRGQTAVRHIFRVASGIESMIVGEREILGQLRTAFDEANEGRIVGQHLNYLFTKALAFGRRVREETNISRGNISVSSVGVNIAAKVYSDLSRKTVLVVGAGETARLTVQHLRARGIGGLLVANRTHERAVEVAESFNGDVVPFAELASAIARADIIVCATGSKEYLLTIDLVSPAIKKDPGRTRVFLDLSMPRNIDPQIGELDQVFCYGMEDLEDIARSNRSRRESEIERVEELLEDEAERFRLWQRKQDAARLAGALRKRVEEIRQEHLDRHGRHLEDEEMERLNKFTDSLLRSVLHDLTKNIRSIDMESEVGMKEFELIQRLFNLQSEEQEDE